MAAVDAAVAVSAAASAAAIGLAAITAGRNGARYTLQLLALPPLAATRCLRAPPRVMRFE